MDTLTVKGPIKRRIERKVPGANLLVDDRADLPGPGVGGKFAALVANFVGKAEAHGPFPLFRYMHAGPNMVANPVPALAILHGSKNVEARLEPVVEAVRNLDGFVELVVGRKKAVLEGLRALEGEIAVQFHHGVTGFHLIVSVDLNFVIVLRANGKGQRCR